MTLTIAEAEQLTRAGAAAIQRGDHDTAKRDLDILARSGRANVQIWLMLAHCCSKLSDWPAAETAADAVLAKDEGNVRALIIKGDARVASGDLRAGASLYGAAVRRASLVPALPSDLRVEVARVEQAIVTTQDAFAAELSARIAAAGVASPSARFAESVDILCEKKQVYRQEPTAYFFPQLPQRQFYEREEFDWVETIEAAAGDMLEELRDALADNAPFKPYFESREDRPSYDFHGLLDNPAWSTLYLFENGAPVADNVARFPKTFAALQHAPAPHITVRAPSMLFSLLQGGARIAPHNGMINTRLICHLPLIVPPGCGFRVGNETREWEVGRVMIFDDSIEHEAWNDSDQDRVIVIFDIWRPELTDDERRSVTAIFEAIDA
ncbi:aspartyl/asparaginyl beta-hydroxylase domain-containing protein [Sphingomonas bacterium]|uniref:aspartyl/asparaginyl beta-hydroxylase domain-containing protein n=1 Tax=Sphingomonas bacterium TaxID=1895847 RepID=UPI00262226B5|nr:aspartyl/asparaginyl beta-hydroxylase domain-containing protein [Sphingomonas bacterium]MDB5679734.1 hypothetical protein [Sphingomonas bacterium]